MPYITSCHKLGPQEWQSIQCTLMAFCSVESIPQRIEALLRVKGVLPRISVIFLTKCLHTSLCILYKSITPRKISYLTSSWFQLTTEAMVPKKKSLQCMYRISLSKGIDHERGTNIFQNIRYTKEPSPSSTSWENRVPHWYYQQQRTGHSSKTHETARKMKAAMRSTAIHG